MFLLPSAASHPYVPTLEEQQVVQQRMQQSAAVRQFLLATSENRNTSCGFQRLLPLSRGQSPDLPRDSCSTSIGVPAGASLSSPDSLSRTRTFVDEIRRRTNATLSVPAPLPRFAHLP